MMDATRHVDVARTMCASAPPMRSPGWCSPVLADSSPPVPRPPPRRLSPVVATPPPIQRNSPPSTHSANSSAQAQSAACAGDTVVLKGLVERPELNDALGVYLGAEQPRAGTDFGRYVVKLDGAASPVRVGPQHVMLAAFCDEDEAEDVA